MPFFKAGSKLVYYAHVPKCGGSAVERYIHGRCGEIAFLDNAYMSVPRASRWSRTSPQHIDRASLARLIPASFFDMSFTIVRHPVARIVSAFHFQLEVERTIPADTRFSYWLEELRDILGEDGFVYDNHLLPMNDIVPEGAAVFHLEHGLDGLVPWFDGLLGNTAAPRAVPHVNARGAYRGSGGGEKVQPDAQDLELIADLYAADFARFGYRLDDRMPAAPAPVLSEALIAERDAELRAAARAPREIAKRLARKIGL